MPIGLVLGLLASVGWGCVDISSALAGRSIGSLRVLVWTQWVGLLVLGIFLLLPFGGLGPAPLAGVLVGLPLGLISAVSYLSYYTALRIGPLSVVSPVIMAYGGLTVVLAVMLRGESLLPMQAAGAAMATGGVFLVGVVFNGQAFRGARLVGPGVAVAMVTVVAFAALSIFSAPPIRDYGWVPVVVGTRISNASVAAGFLLVARRSRSDRLGALLLPHDPLTRRVIRLLLIAGVCDVAAYSVYSLGLQVAPIWLVGLTSSFQPVFVVAYAVTRLGEDLRPSQWAGLLLLAAGLIVLTIGG